MRSMQKIRRASPWRAALLGVWAAAVPDNPARRTASLAVLLTLALSGSASAEPLNILYFGNSFTLGYGSWRSVPDVVSDIAVAAGHQIPTTVDASYPGADFWYHANSNTGPISTSLPSGQRWDYVVMQNYSTAPTHIGGLTDHLAHGQLLYNQVAAHSPAVVPVLFETWARAPGHDFYTGANPDFPGGPAEMQQELHDGYQLLAAQIGPQARVASVGSAFESAGFSSTLYASDLWHAENRGTLLAALVVYESIYGDLSSNVDLSSVRNSLGLTEADGLYIEGIAGVPEPSTVALAALGAILLSVRGLRRRVV